jgi:hypothetical protein
MLHGSGRKSARWNLMTVGPISPHFPICPSADCPNRSWFVQIASSSQQKFVPHLKPHRCTANCGAYGRCFFFLACRGGNARALGGFVECDDMDTVPGLGCVVTSALPDRVGL